MQKSSLLYVITKLELGGAQKQLLSLIRHLNKDNFRPFLFTANAGILLPEALSISGLTLNKSRWLECPIHPLKELFALIEIIWFIKKNRIKIVHTHSSKAGILGRWAAQFAGVKIIAHTVHGWSFNEYQPAWEQKFFIWLERLTARFTDKLIVVSNYDKEKGLANRIGDENKYSLIRYGIDYSRLNADGGTIKKELGIGPNEAVVGMVACFKPQKSPQHFIKLAFLVKQGLPNVKFVLVGDGILRKKIEMLINKFNLQRSVILTGWRSDIPKILSAIDIFALTSLWEGLPVSILEAMASSKPIIATDTGGVREVINDGETGFLVAPGDMDKMSQRLDLLLRDASLRIVMGQKARDSLDANFTIAHMVRKNESLYEDAIKGKGAAYAG